MNLFFHRSSAVNANPSSIFAGRLIFYDAINHGKQGVILTDPYVETGVYAGAPLPDQDSPSVNTLTGKYLNTQPLSLTISAVTASATTFFMRHLLSPLHFCGWFWMPVWLLPYQAQLSCLSISW